MGTDSPTLCSGFKFSQLEMSTSAGCPCVTILTLVSFVLEVALAVLLSTFTFEHTEKEIKWNLASIIYPTVGDEKRPSLPLKVEIVERN